MATIYRKAFTKALPAGAELVTQRGQRSARWKDGKGKTRTARVTTGRSGAERIIVQAGTFTAKYRDGEGVVREASMGCRDANGARSVLAELTRRAELVKAKVMTAAESTAADHGGKPLAARFNIESRRVRRRKKGPGRG